MGDAILFIILVLVMTVVITAIRRAGVDGIIILLAQGDKWWSPVRMDPSPGELQVMTVGIKPGGDFAMVLAGHIPEWHLSKADWKLYKEGTPEFRAAFPDGPPVRTGRLASIKVTWVGLFRRRYKRIRRYLSWDLLNGKYQIVEKKTKEGEEHIFYFSTTMALDLRTMKTIDRYDTQMKIVFNALMIDLRKAEFVAGKWEVQSMAAPTAKIRLYIARHTQEELFLENDTIEDDGELIDEFLSANNDQGSGTLGILKAYGIMLSGAYLEDFDIEETPEAKEMLAAKQRQAIAKEDVITAKIRIEEAANKGKAAAAERREAAAGIRDEWEARQSVPEGVQFTWAEAVRNSNLKAFSLGLGQDGRGGIIFGINSDED